MSDNYHVYFYPRRIEAYVVPNPNRDYSSTGEVVRLKQSDSYFIRVSARSPREAIERAFLLVGEL